jgi:hypothetical protein
MHLIKLLLISALFYPSSAFAYIDPGTGSMVVQILIAGALGAGFAIRTFWSNIRSYFSGARAGSENTDSDNTES